MWIETTMKLSDDLTHHLRYVWEQIGMDVLASKTETTGENWPSIPRDEVVELVMDCDRIRTFAFNEGEDGLLAEIEELYKLKWEKRLALVTNAFEDCDYGY